MTLDTLAYVVTIATGIVAILTLAYQIYQDASAKREETAAVKTSGKMKIISDLVANRHVLRLRTY